MIYLDNNATTGLAPEVRDALLSFLDGEYGNPSSKNAPGQRAKESVMAARQAISATLEAAPAELIFTGSATESNHTAILGALRQSIGRRHIVSTEVEHPSTLKLLRWLENQGMTLTLIPVDTHGALDMAALDAAITDATALVSVMWANNETGVVYPVEEIAQLAKSRGALFHTDAVQALGRLPLVWKQSAIDLLSFSGHKLHAPQGIGGLLVRRGLNIPPLLFGSQERNRRGGTENVMGIAGLGVAAKLLDAAEHSRLESLRNQMEIQICSALPFARINGMNAPRVANTSNIQFGELNSEALLLHLERAGIIASSGAACQSGGNQPSHVLTAMGLDKTAAQASLRFSLSRYTTAEEMERATASIITTALALEWQRIDQSVLYA